MNRNWRSDFTILVTDAHAIGALATVRSLGRAGYRTIASSPRADAIAFHSHFCTAGHVWPGADDGLGGDVLAALDRLIERERIGLIIPSESFLLLIRGRFRDYSHLLPLPQDPQLAYRSLSKWDLFESSQRAGLTDNLPPFRLVDCDGKLPPAEALRDLPLPLFLKTDAVYARRGRESGVVRCGSHADAARKIVEIAQSHRRLLIQGFVVGAGVGAFLATWEGRPLAEFMHRRIHEVPHTGGASSYRASWFHAAVLADAKARAQAMQWDGVGMFEYRWDERSNRFFLMEFNSRFWGSLHLALYAGVDFPRLLADAFFRRPDQPVTNWSTISSRYTFPGEVGYVLSCVKDRGLSWQRRLWPLPEFVLLAVDPRVRSDLAFPGDRALQWRMMARAARHFLR